MSIKSRTVTISTFCLWLMSVLFHLSANEYLVNPTPWAVLPNLNQRYSLINSVDFHPQKNLFCVTYTQNNKVVLYNIGANNQVQTFQTLSNPASQLSEPQNAVFSPNGKKIVVANWTNQTLAVYNCGKDGLFNKEPVAIIPVPTSLRNCKAHGIAFSPCGNYFAIAYGVTVDYDRAVALFHITEDASKGMHFQLTSMLKSANGLPGVPKGITFSPDGTCLLVTFCDVNSIVIFDIDQKNQAINPVPRQTVQGAETKIFRPEDIKISPDGGYCVITNSDRNTVTFYLFDKTSNFIMQNAPCYTLQNPQAQFCFPHGIAFSADGAFLAITQFGPIYTSEDGNICCDPHIKPSAAKVNLYTGITKGAE